MKFFATLASALTLTFGAAAQDTTPIPADTVIWGGPVYTANGAQPRAEAVAVRAGRFVFVGSRTGAQALVGESTEVIDLKGAALFPGFVDAHAHLAGIGERELTLNLEGIASLAALKEAIVAWRADHPAEVLVGRGWIETHWPEGRFPSRFDLDAVIADIPVILTRADGHALVANTRAFELAGITADTDAPSGGDILKNALGEPTGMLIDAAQSLIAPVMPAVTAEDQSIALATGARVYAEYGWTGLHNMSVSWAEVQELERLADAGEVKIRVYNSIDPSDAEALFAVGHSENADGRIVTRAIKMYMDGALGSRGAALLAPYTDADTSGLLLTSHDDALPLMERALRDGIQINMHAIGDRGNRLLLDWYGEAFASVPVLDRGVADPRWRDEHTQTVSPDDIPRFAELGVIASMQPSHAIGDLHFAPARLGEERLKGAYAWASLLAAGAHLAGGSDAPVERGDPLIEFYAAIARRDLNGFQGPDWHAEEALTRAQALDLFTQGAAYASFQEDRLGSITVGKDADLTAFSVDLMTADPAEIPKGHAVLTMVKGDIAYRAAD